MLTASSGSSAPGLVAGVRYFLPICTHVLGSEPSFASHLAHLTATKSMAGKLTPVVGEVQGRSTDGVASHPRKVGCSRAIQLGAGLGTADAIGESWRRPPHLPGCVGCSLLPPWLILSTGVPRLFFRDRIAFGRGKLTETSSRPNPGLNLRLQSTGAQGELQSDVFFASVCPASFLLRFWPKLPSRTVSLLGSRYGRGLQTTVPARQTIRPSPLRRLTRARHRPRSLQLPRRPAWS